VAGVHQTLEISAGYLPLVAAPLSKNQTWNDCTLPAKQLNIQEIEYVYPVNKWTSNQVVSSLVFQQYTGLSVDFFCGLFMN
jgi:hypothetical protein